MRELEYTFNKSQSNNLSGAGSNILEDFDKFNV